MADSVGRGVGFDHNFVRGFMFLDALTKKKYMVAMADITARAIIMMASLTICSLFPCG
jgi:hypothetical protein